VRFVQKSSCSRCSFWLRRARGASAAPCAPDPHPRSEVARRHALLAPERPVEVRAVLKPALETDVGDAEAVAFQKRAGLGDPDLATQSTKLASVIRLKWREKVDSFMPAMPAATDSRTSWTAPNMSSIAATAL
jgi:hypothetical protein